MDGFRYDSHPMSILAATIAALSGFYPDARHVKDAGTRRAQMIRLIAKMPTIAAFSYRHSQGLPYVYPDNELSYCGNFLAMIRRMTEAKYKVNPVLERALDILFILHADHEQNCSTTATRVVGSSEVDPYSAVAAGITAIPGISANSFLPARATVGGTSSNTFAGKGSTENSNDFSGTITATVIEVLPNGHLVISGEKQIGVNHNVDVLRFSGQVDPRAIQTGNSVASAQIANVRIEQRGKGQQADAQGIGWLGRFFLNVLPI
jgi:hypothetical protein